MKTIEEAVIEFIDLNIDSNEYDLREREKRLKLAFYTGVEFAQQWINVELDPPKNSNPVLGRYEQCTPEVCEYFDSIKEWINSESRDIITVTHWRPIEYK